VVAEVVPVIRLLALVAIISALLIAPRALGLGQVEGITDQARHFEELRLQTRKDVFERLPGR
jgi:hypothetical protein